MCNDWAFIHAPVRVNRILACCLSHLSLWKYVATLPDPYVFIFEDDCSFINDDVKTNFIDYFDALELPPDFGILWLNGTILDTPGTPTVGPFELNEYQLHNTTESYVLTPGYALELIGYIETRLGAVDAFMEHYTRTTPGRSFRVFPPMFCQSDRQDTDIQQ
jgi:GR25 family glycosyltransferase involved in LPS biosynthesis